jgi:surface protein
LGRRKHSTDVNDTISHTYSKEGNYTVKIYGKFPAIYFNCNWDSDNIIGQTSLHSVIIAYDNGYSYVDSYLEELVEIQKWGDIEWKSFHHAFSCATNLKIKTTDTPNLKNVKDMSAAFVRIDEMPDNLGDWNVSSVEDMSYLFMGMWGWDVGKSSLYPKIKKSISKWDVSNVKNMKYMFAYNEEFNVSLNEWNVSNVTNMEGIFQCTKVFNQPLNNWNVSNVTNMKRMFEEALAFNQPINNWDVSNVTDMSEMFMWALNFNQPLNDWNVSNVTNMNEMFESTNFNQPLNDWNVSNVKSMVCMFCDSSFNQPLDKWDVSNVTNMQQMFYDAKFFDQNISMWDVSNVTNYTDFATGYTAYCPIYGTDKMPHFK